MRITWRPAAFVLTIALSLPTSRVAAEEACTYSVDPSAIAVTWTAFKFSNKTAVSGRFNTTKVSGRSSADSLVSLAEGLSMEIDGTSVETDNPARNATISEFFFGKFVPSGKIAVSVTDVRGDETQGKIDMKIEMNRVSRVVTFGYAATPEGDVVATGAFNMLDWNLKAAHDSIHVTCEEQHTGPDGVAKTWTDVVVTVTGKYTRSESCPTPAPAPAGAEGATGATGAQGGTGAEDEPAAAPQ